MITQTDNVAGTDRLIRLNDVPKLSWLPDRRAGSKLNVSTVWRWGLKGTAGIKLQTVSVGGTLCTSERWLKEFFAAVGEARLAASAPGVPIRTPHQREKDYQASVRRLAAKGIGPGVEAASNAS